MVKVRRRRGEPFEAMLKRFNQGVRKDGTLTKYLSRAAYMPPNEVRRSAANKAAKKAAKQNDQ